jgi:hypothetical protein
MQVSRFTNGGFVLHKIQPQSGGVGNISAWFDAAGKLLDCERYNIAGRSCKISQADRSHLLLLGEVWKNEKTTPTSGEGASACLESANS